VIAEASGTQLHVVHEESVPSPWYHNLVWSPSGDRLLFSQTPRSRCDVLSAASELRLVDISTGRVTTTAAVPGIRPIRVSPDGDGILFTTVDDSQVGTERYRGLWSMDTDGSHMQLLVPNTVFGDWQPFLGQ
jgi:dipeptidyl aminopeptidase/acylaminoacyl peptidase